MKEIFYLGKKVEVIVDRPIGSKHPTHDFLYKLNYGYLPQTEGGDGEEIDVYIVDVHKPIDKAVGKVIGMVIRKNDDENKLLLTTRSQSFSKKSLKELVHFQEQFFDAEILLLADLEAAYEQDLGLAANAVDLKSHSPYWKYIFAREACEIKRLLGARLLAIEHVGSTSIETIQAKPIIDILIGVDSFGSLEEMIAALEGYGYRYKGEMGIPGRHFFIKGAPGRFHIHLSIKDSKFYEELILFRASMQRDPGIVEEYEQVKLVLKAKYKDNREAYTKGKNDFIQGILAKTKHSE